MGTEVIYRKAKLWQVICYAFNAFIGMSVYTLIGMASYSANLGFGIATAAVGLILTFTRILDGVTDPLLAILYDSVNTKFGKIRPLLCLGFVIEALALLSMFVWFPGKTAGVGGLVLFVVLYVIYVIGYTIINMTAQTIPALISNDPKQRPLIGVWVTAFNYLLPMSLGILFNVVLLPMYGGTYTLDYLAAACKICMVIALIGLLFVCLGVSAYDKPENFAGFNARNETIKIKDMLIVLKNNRPLQCFVASEASDKLAQIAGSQSIITTMLYGILIGNMGLSTILNMIAMLPSILFAVLGARYAGKHGSKEAIVTWTKVSMGITVIMTVFLFVIDTTQIAAMLSVPMILYTLITFALNGSKMCITTANTSYMADVIDYELDRSGEYIPAVITGVYSFVDKIISSFGAAIAAGAVALIGYTETMPQPGDPLTTPVIIVTIAMMYIFPLIGWICTLIAMKFCHLDKEEMVQVQKRIADRKKSVHGEQE
ncbi:MAG: MFS transporter [Eubacteriales bacterium]|nr:MFS transporter [Eubacteriales bacterium]